MSGTGALDPRLGAHLERRRRQDRTSARRQWNRAVSATLAAAHVTEGSTRAATVSCRCNSADYGILTVPSAGTPTERNKGSGKGMKTTRLASLSCDEEVSRDEHRRQVHLLEWFRLSGCLPIAVGRGTVLELLTCLHRTGPIHRPKSPLTVSK